jgi:hypothetical protein
MSLTVRTTFLRTKTVFMIAIQALVLQGGERVNTCDDSDTRPAREKHFVVRVGTNGEMKTWK